MLSQLIPIFIPILIIISCQSPVDKIGSGTIRVISHNVYFGFTKIPERKEVWLDWMKNQRPDIVSLQELNEYTSEKLQEEAQSWNHSFSVLLKENGFPTGITSRFPIEDVQRYLEGFHHGLIRVKIQGIYFYVIHLHPSNWEVRHREIDFILNNISGLSPDSKILLAGDFNTFAPIDSIYYAHGRLEPFFNLLDARDHANNLDAGQLDYSVIQKLTDYGFVDLEAEHRPTGYQFTGSFPALLETEGEHGDLRRLDYIFASPNLSSKIITIQIMANDTTQYLSDHLPVVLDLDL